MATQSLMPTVDPNNVGNPPGQGPLRAGGESPAGGVAPTDKSNRPDTKSPEYQDQEAELKLCRDLGRGQRAVKEAGQTYLPGAPAERPDDYASRLKRSVFFNAFKQARTGLAGLVFKKDPKLGVDVPEVIAGDREAGGKGGHWENIDLAGTHGDVFLKQSMEDMLEAGHAAILVEFPDTAKLGQLRLDQSQRLRPYWVPIRKDDILSWRTTNIEGRTVLTQVVIQTEVAESVGAFGKQLVRKYLVIQRDPDWNERTDVERTQAVAPVTWQLLYIDKAGVVQSAGNGQYVGQDEIPLAELVTSGHQSMFCSVPPLVDLAYLNVAHYQMWSDYATSIHKTCVPILTISGVQLKKDKEGQPINDVVAGPNTVLVLENPQAKASYTAHDGQSLEQVKAALDDLKSDMGVIGLQMLAPQKRTAETAEAKRIDNATMESALATTARGLQDGGERALGFHAKYLRLSDGGSLIINRDFEGLLMEAPVMMAYAQLRSVGFPPRVILKALKAGGRIPEDEDLVKLEAEMEANYVAEQQRKQLEAEENAERIASGGE